MSWLLYKLVESKVDANVMSRIADERCLFEYKDLRLELVAQDWSECKHQPVVLILNKDTSCVRQNEEDHARAARLKGGTARISRREQYHLGAVLHRIIGNERVKTIEDTSDVRQNEGEDTNNKASDTTNRHSLGAVIMMVESQDPSWDGDAGEIGQEMATSEARGSRQVLQENSGGRKACCIRTSMYRELPEVHEYGGECTGWATMTSALYMATTSSNASGCCSGEMKSPHNK
ncbi:hypothetical protein EDD22DRAFT_849480 [Suillus occidentalis]|nr:hypothetical protein EDD22DRAFT_849480 [Suillus occidentalis]